MKPAPIGAEAAAMASRAAGVGAQRVRFNQNRVLDFLQLDGSVAHVALAHGNRRVLAVRPGETVRNVRVALARPVLVWELPRQDARR